MGPLSSLRVLEIGGIGPVPFTGMLLSDLGADVVRVERPVQGDMRDAEGRTVDPRREAMARGRRSVALDMKRPAARDAVLRLVEGADALVEGYRPGVMERLGLAPDDCLRVNPRLVYGRLTGWGQGGPLAQSPGHDLNYLALSGALEAFARPGQPPTFPLTLLGNFAGGGMLMAFGLVSAILEARTSGEGQVIDSAVVDGIAVLSTLYHGFLAQGRWRSEPGTNLVDGGAPFYDVHRTSDGSWVAVAPIESAYFDRFAAVLGLDPSRLPDRGDPKQWPNLREQIATCIATRTRADWFEHFDAYDACMTPVLGLGEAPEHPHNIARGTFVTVDGVRQPAPAPRFSRTPTAAPRRPPTVGEHTADILAEAGYSVDEISRIVDQPG